MAFADGTRSKQLFDELSDRLTQEQEVNQEYAEQLSNEQDTLFNYLIPVKAYDEFLLPKINQINSKKQQIVTLLAAAYNGGTSSCTFSNSNVTSSIARPGTSVDFTYNTVLTGKRAEIREDVLGVFQYPDIENYNLSAANDYFNNTEYTRITSLNIGLGETLYHYYDGNDAQGLSAGSTLLGYYYTITNTTGSCSTTKDSVNTLESEILTLRNQINDFITANGNALNSLRKIKNEKNLAVYNSVLLKDSSDEAILILQDSITNLSSNETLISNYENSL